MLKKIYNLKFSVVAGLVALMGLTACGDYLDVVPDDGNATEENAFALRSVAIRYLATIYTFMPKDGCSGGDPAILGSDEYVDTWGRVVSNTSSRVPYTYTRLARGYQGSVSPIGYDWSTMYKGIRYCDNLMDNIYKVPDMQDEEKEQWKAEAKFLKALFHFELIRKWGAVPVTRHSLPVDAGIEDVRVYREPIDTCFNYVIQLLDEAIPNLPLTVGVADYGRITQPIAMAFKARVACYAASPLFNGNEEQNTLIDNRGVRLFPSKTEEEKRERWADAVKYCKEAIDNCELAGIQLYKYNGFFRMNDTLKLDMGLRGIMTDRWNTELIWGQTHNDRTQVFSWQQMTTPNLQRSMSATASFKGGGLDCYGFVGISLKAAEQFYTKNGLPMGMDKTRVGQDESQVRLGDVQNEYYIERNYETINFNFDREPRYYANVGFDGCKWVTALENFNDLTPEKIPTLGLRLGKPQGKGMSGSLTETGSPTGLYAKKGYPYQNRLSSETSAISTYWYPYPLMRLADLYLLYAEAINEAEGPDGEHSADMYKYINAVRERAQIPDVKTSWDQYSTNPGFYSTQAGMREIIHQERLIELSFESQRFWDLRRWKTAPVEYAKGIYGYDIMQSDASEFYKKTLVYEQPFTTRDYFWPISISDLEHNPNLIQNIGW